MLKLKMHQTALSFLSSESDEIIAVSRAPTYCGDVFGRSVPVYHKAKFWIGDSKNHRLSSNEFDVVHAIPARTSARGRPVDGQFDTVLVNDGAGRYIGLAGTCRADFPIHLHYLILYTSCLGHRVARVKAIFTLPKAAANLFAGSDRPRPRYLAYVEWFLKFPARPDPNHGLYKIKASIRDGDRLASVIPLRTIRRSVYLFPNFGPVAPREWTSANVLDRCTTFYVDVFSDRHAYHTMI